MTVQTNTNSISYVGNGSTVHFDYDFLVLDAGHLTVYFGDVLQTSGYVVSGVLSQTGGTVAFAAAPGAGVEITLTRSVPFLQLTDYQPYDAFPAESHERALDLLTMMAQQLKDASDRSMQYPVGGNKWDAKNNEIINVANGGADSSAANVGQVKSLIASLAGPDSAAQLRVDLAAPSGVDLVAGAVKAAVLAGTGGGASVGTANGLSVQAHLNKSGSILSFAGVVADGVADDTAAVQAALDTGLPIHIPSGATVKVTSVTISKRGSALYGPGRLIGQIIVAMPQVGDPYQSIIAISRISGVKFIGNTEPIVLRRGRGILIDGNTFDDITSSAVVVRPLPADFDGASHCVEDVNICHNLCSFVDRLLRIDTSNITAQLVPNWWLGNGDIHVFNNIVRVARILHIDADRVDGLSVKGNTFLHFGSGAPNKTHCVRVSTKGSQVIISGNEFFEPGLSAIKLVEVENFNINGNNFIDCGQLAPSSAIEVTYTLQAPNVTFSGKGIIYGNSINGTTAHAVLLSNMSNVVVFGNTIRLNSSPVYYGASPLPAFADRYGVYTEQSGTSAGILVDNNLVIDAKTRQYNAFSSVGLTDAGTTRYDLSTAATSLNANYEQVNLVQPSATTIVSVTGGFEGRVLRLITFNGNTTIANNATIKTGTGANKLLPNDSVHTLTNYGGVWYLK